MEFLFVPVDAYCERTSPSYWAEPLNALSNLAFIAAGLGALLLARRAGADRWTRLLCWWAVAIGVGSFLFHTHAQVWAVFADTLPIWSFVLAYLTLALRRYFGLGPRTVAAILVAGVAGAALTMPAIPPGIVQATGGSIQYLPALTALCAVSVCLWYARHPAAGMVSAAMMTFVVSLFFRTIDMRVCDSFAYGSHFVWHLLNATVLGLLLIAAIRHGQQDGAKKMPDREGPAFVRR